MIKLRELTTKENKEFQRLCKEDDLLNNNLDLQQFSSGKEINVEINEDEKFDNKFELGEYLYRKLCDFASIDNSIWNFLAIVYHKKLLNSNGKIGDIDRFYIDSQKSSYPYTHLLKPVFDLYSFYHDNADLVEFLLLNPINESSYLFLAIVKSQDLMRNKNFIQVSKKFSYDEKEKKIRKGIREDFYRLITLLKQYERTYDLYSMPADKIIKDLISKHKEFDKYKTIIFD